MHCCDYVHRESIVNYNYFFYPAQLYPHHPKLIIVLVFIYLGFYILITNTSPYSLSVVLFPLKTFRGINRVRISSSWRNFSQSLLTSFWPGGCLLPGTQLGPGHSWEAFCFSALLFLPWFMSSTTFFRKHFKTVNGRKCLYSAFMFNSHWAMYGIWVRNHFPSEFSRHCLLASSLLKVSNIFWFLIPCMRPIFFSLKARIVLTFLTSILKSSIVLGTQWTRNLQIN